MAVKARGEDDQAREESRESRRVTADLTEAKAATVIVRKSAAQVARLKGG